MLPRLQGSLKIDNLKVNSNEIYQKVGAWVPYLEHKIGRVGSLIAAALIIIMDVCF